MPPSTNGEVSSISSHNVAPGSIVRIVFKNFLTYDFAVMTPGPHLNLILGPNGSGKSSIICGICLAVGGSPKALGRSEQLCDYIKHGCHNGYVEVHLANASKNVDKFCIKLERPTKVEYYHNDKMYSHRALRDFVIANNIQIDNPCTFLAQDKVKGFSEQSPIELLANTLMAGSMDLHKKHCNLIQKKDVRANLEKAKYEMVARIAALNGEIDTLRPRVELYHKMQKMISSVRLIETKICMIEHSNALNERASTKDDLKMIIKQSTELQNKKRNMEAVCGQLRSTRVAALSQYKQMMMASERKLEAIERKASDYEKELAELESNVQALKIQYEQALAGINGVREFQKESEEKVRRLRIEEDDVDGQHATWEAESQELVKAKDELKSHATKYREVFEKRSSVLRTYQQSFPEAYEAWTWYQQHREEFQKPVYIPLLHINIAEHDYEAQRLICNLVNVNNHAIFIFGCKDDEMKLSGKFKHISTTVVTPEQLHCIPVGSAVTEGVFEKACVAVQECRMRMFVTKQNIVRIGRSTYSGKSFKEVVPLKDHKNFQFTMQPLPKVQNDEQARKALTEKEHVLREKYKEITDRRRDIQLKRDELQNRRKEWNDKIRLERTISTQLDHFREKLKEQSGSRPNVKKAHAEFAIERKNAFKQFLERLATACSKAKEENEGANESSVIHISELRMKKVRNVRLRVYDECKTEVDACQHRKLAVETALETAQAKVHRLSDELKKLCDLPDSRMTKLNEPQRKAYEELQQKFKKAKLSDDETDLIVLVKQQKTKIEMTGGSSSVSDEERMKKLIEEVSNLEKDSEKQASKIVDWENEFMQEVTEWRQPVEKLVSKISETFVAFFQRLSCTGKVELDVPEDPLNVAAYGIGIYVVFRKGEKMKRLDHQVQSGGERSVSTMLYLLALQELSPVPFRCVDEINQGMDPTNERKVFEILVETLSNVGNLAKTQYFLLTPKLLTGLHFNEKVSMQLVLNSRGLQEGASNWDPKKFAKIAEERKRQRLVTSS